MTEQRQPGLFPEMGTEFEAEHGAPELARRESEIPFEHPGARYSIQRLKLWNFKGFREFEIKFSGFNVLVGANNSGKSTILKAIRLGYELTKMHFDRLRDGHAVFLRGRSIPRSFLPVAQLRDLWPGGQMRRGNIWIQSQIEIQLKTGHRLKYGIIGPWNAATSRIADEDIAQMEGIPGDVIAAFLERPPELVPASIGIVAEEEYRTPARRASLVSSGRHNEIIRNYLHDLGPDERSELEQILRLYFRARVQGTQFDPDKDPFVYAAYSTDDYSHDLYSAGGGFLQVVEVLAFILRGRPGVVLLDEPDSHLNSSLQHAMVDILERLASTRGFQVLLATHSKEIINYVDPSRLIHLDRAARLAAPLDAGASTVTLLKELGAVDNVDAYHIVRRKAMLLVEGSTDRELLPRLSVRALDLLFTGDSRVSVVPVGGVSILRNDAPLAVLREALGAPVRCFALRDRDGLVDAWRERLMAEAVVPSFVWKLDCIESYLLSPEAIAKIVAEDLEADPIAITAEVKEIINNCTASMKEETLDRVAQRLQEVSWVYERERPDAARVNPIARAAVNAVWDDPASRLQYVSGKSALGKVRVEVQKRWGVSFGNPRIVEALEEGNLHADILELLRKVRDGLQVAQ